MAKANSEEEASESDGAQFGASVRARRKSKGLSQEALAGKALGNIGRKGYISDVERGKVPNITPESVRKIAEALGIDRTEVPASLRWPGGAPGWPAILSPGTRVERTVQGREDDVAALHDKLTTAGQVAIVSGEAPANHTGTVVKGMGGIGKSTLARHYIATHATRYRGIWWLRAETEETLVEDLCELSGHLDIDPSAHPTPKALARASVMKLSRETEPWLLVYDNATSAAALKPWCPDTGPVALLVTSREGHWPGFFTYQTERLALEPATDLLLQEARCDGPRDHDRDGARALAKTLDGLPLALVLAGGWLRDVPDAGFADYAARLAELLDTEPEDAGVGDYPTSLKAAVSLSLSRLKPEAALLMQVFAHLDGDDLWPGLVAALAAKEDVDDTEHGYYSSIPPELWTLARDENKVVRVFKALTHASLLESVAPDPEAEPPPAAERAYRLHRLTQAVQRALAIEASANTAEPLDWPAIAAALLAAGHPGAANNPQYRENWPACLRLGLHVARLAAAPPETAAMDYVLDCASVYLSAQRQDERALAYSQTSLRLKEARLGPVHREVGATCNNLAVSYWRQGRLEEAEALSARAVEIGEAGHGTEANLAVRYNVHGIMADTLGRRAQGAEQTERLALAAKRKRQALALSLRLHGRHSRQVPTNLNNLAGLRVFQGRWGAALRLHARALTLRRAALPPGDPDVAAGLNHLGSTLLHAGRTRQGYRGHAPLDLLTEALDIWEAAFPDRPDHPNRVTTAGWLASAHWTLAALGPPHAGSLTPDPAKALSLCETYGLDPAAEQAKAETYAEHARRWEADGTEPPGEIEG